MSQTRPTSFSRFFELPRELQIQIFSLVCPEVIITNTRMYKFTEPGASDKIMYRRLTSPRTGKELHVYASPQTHAREGSSATKAPLTGNELVPYRRTETEGVFRLMTVDKLARQTALEWWRREVKRRMIPKASKYDNLKHEEAVKYLLVEVLGDLIKQVEKKPRRR